MSRFNPQPNDKIAIEATTYEIMAHPAVKTMVFGQEGRKATVYQLRTQDELYALKIFKKPFRTPHLVDTCQALSQITIDGLEVCDRICLTDDTAPALLQQYPEMEYAILMPWMQGSTWFDIVYGKSAFDRDTSLRLAHETATIFANLENQRIAHCDISGANVIVDANHHEVMLIDVEDMFGPGLTLTDGYPRGTDGYQHTISRQAKTGQWCLEGDRFAGAILLAEMITWHEEEIQRAAGEEHFFAPNELQDSASPNYKLMVDALADMSSEVSKLFVQAWESNTLAECPPLEAWSQQLRPQTLKTLTEVAVSPVSEWVPFGQSEEFTSVSLDTIPISPISILKSLDTPELWLPTEADIDQDYQVSWTAIAKAVDYELQIADSLILVQSGLFTNLYRGSQTAFATSNQLAKNYYYRVRAISGSGQPSDWSPVKSLKICSDEEVSSQENRQANVLAIPTWLSEYITWEQVNNENQKKVTISTEIPWYRDSPEDTYELAHKAPDSSIVFHRYTYASCKLTLDQGSHRFGVRIVDRNNNKGQWSKILCINIGTTFWSHKLKVRVYEEG